jgi:hypothetical protein
MTQYAGQLMTNGAQAETYANHFIAVHLKGIGGGKTYWQLSAESLANAVGYGCWHVACVRRRG